MCATTRFFVLAIATLSWVATHGQSALSEEEWINALRGGGHVIVIRHGATPPDQADTDPLHLENIDKQRQLNDAGRAQARSIGAAMRKLKIPVGEVYTSMFNRAVETGKLPGFGEVRPSIDFAEGGPVVTSIENSRRAQALRKLAATVPFSFVATDTVYGSGMIEALRRNAGKGYVLGVAANCVCLRSALEKKVIK
jgi:hypothetical protein